MKTHSNVVIKKKTLRLPETLIVQVDEIAASEQRSFNFMMNEAARLLVESKRPKKKRAYRKRDGTQEKEG